MRSVRVDRHEWRKAPNVGERRSDGMTKVARVREFEEDLLGRVSLKKWYRCVVRAVRKLQRTASSAENAVRAINSGQYTRC